MKTYKFLSINKKLPRCEATDFRSTLSLTDFDIVIIDPDNVAGSFPNPQKGSDNQLYLNKSDSVSMYATIRRRKAEIDSLLMAGKIIVSFLTPPRSYLLHVDGRNMLLDNYSWIPDGYHNIVFDELVNGNGKRLQLTNKEHLFAQYFYAFKEELYFTAYVDIRADHFPHEVFISNLVNHTIGFSLNVSNGKLVFIPEYTSNESAKEKFMGILIQIAHRYFGEYVKSTKPAWLKDYVIPGLEKHDDAIREKEREIGRLEALKSQTIMERDNLDDFKFLLYEQGLPLQEKVVQALRMIGFKAETKQIQNTDLDVVLESDEGRAIAEVEGKDDSAINKDKITQLFAAINEDQESSKGVFAKGILIGNHYRNRKVDERDVPFTQAVLNLAQQYQFSLITTADLYDVIVYVLEHQDDIDFRKACREAIFQAKGEIVKFPIPIKNKGE